MMGAWLLAFVLTTFGHWLTWVIAFPGAILGARYLWSPVAIGLIAVLAFLLFVDIPFYSLQGIGVFTLVGRFVPAFAISLAIILSARLAIKLERV